MGGKGGLLLRIGVERWPITSFILPSVISDTSKIYNLGYHGDRFPCYYSNSIVITFIYNITVTVIASDIITYN